MEVRRGDILINSILDSVKKSLGLDCEYDAFDADIIMLINTVFAEYNQMGIGPEDGFEITDDSATWNDYEESSLMAPGLKTLTYLKVKTLFDPPASSVLAEAMKNQI